MSAARILVIEDNPADIALLRFALEALNEDVEFEVCLDGKQALEVVYAQHKCNDRPCVIVLDVNLPKHNGLEVLRAIREEPLLRHVGVVALSGLINPRDQDKLRSLGAHCRQKPMSLAELSELATELIAICKGLLITA